MTAATRLTPLLSLVTLVLLTAAAAPASQPASAQAAPHTIITVAFSGSDSVAAWPTSLRISSRRTASAWQNRDRRSAALTKKSRIGRLGRLI